MDNVIETKNFKEEAFGSGFQENMDRVAQIIPENVDENSIYKGSYTVPIDKLSTLGAGVSSLIPALRTVTVTDTVNLQGLYTVANSDVNAVLQAAKDGTF